jgi:hypothetical protein
MKPDAPTPNSRSPIGGPVAWVLYTAVLIFVLFFLKDCSNWFVKRAVERSYPPKASASMMGDPTALTEFLQLRE